MNISMNSGDDPLGLRSLPTLQASEAETEQNWEVVKAALEQGAVRRRRTRFFVGASLAASLALVFVIAGPPGPDRMADTNPTQAQATQEIATEQASENPRKAPDLIAMSQGLERQLRALRTQAGSLPAELIVYQVELQDLISQVDDALGLAPDSRDLWGQRVSLQLDLMKLYRNQLRRDYHRYASL